MCSCNQSVKVRMVVIIPVMILKRMVLWSLLTSDQAAPPPLKSSDQAEPSTWSASAAGQLLLNLTPTRPTFKASLESLNVEFRRIISCLGPSDSETLAVNKGRFKGLPSRGCKFLREKRLISFELFFPLEGPGSGEPQK